MTSPPLVSFGRRQIGAGQPCYVIAEAGSNHNGDLSQALALIDVAAEAGADAVKFQVFKADKLYPPTAGKSDYLGDDRSIYDIIQAMELPNGWLPRIVEHTRAAGLDFLCSAFDEGAVDLIDPYVDAFKCASYEMNHTPLLAHMARIGKPILLSTGAATLDEVGEAVATVRSAAPGAGLPLVLLQCTASYPAPLESAHLRVMTTLRETFGVWSGLSDHTADPITAPMAAVALGAMVVEKHYTLNKGLPGPDHAFALEPRELREMVQRIRAVEQALGSGVKAVDPAEQELRAFARRSVFSIRTIAEGEAFSRENTAVLRRGKVPAGLEPREHPLIQGRPAARDVPAWQALQPADVGGEGPRPGGDDLRLRRATPNDARAVWEWNNEPDVRRLSLSSQSIPWSTHVAWFSARLASPTSRLWIIESDETPCGIVRLDRELRGVSGVGIVSIALNPKARGRGLGPRALAEACRRYVSETGDSRVEALILPENTNSIRAFLRAGFVHRQDQALNQRTVGIYDWSQ